MKWEKAVREVLEHRRYRSMDYSDEPKVKATDKEIASIIAEIVGLAESDAGVDTAWPSRDVVAKLCDAVDHLLHDHSCDAHGYEEVGTALRVARRWLTGG
jgi:hypothetical protein